MKSALKRDGVTYVTELEPGEAWVMRDDCIIITHPNRAPITIGGAAIDPAIVGGVIVFTPASGGPAREIAVSDAH